MEKGIYMYAEQPAKDSVCRGFSQVLLNSTWSDYLM